MILRPSYVHPTFILRLFCMVEVYNRGKRVVFRSRLCAGGVNIRQADYKHRGYKLLFHSRVTLMLMLMFAAVSAAAPQLNLLYIIVKLFRLLRNKEEQFKVL